MNNICIFVCNGMEEAWYASMGDESERWQLELEIEADVEHEELLAKDFFEEIEENGDADWPEYKELPYEIEMPEIIEL